MRKALFCIITFIILAGCQTSSINEGIHPAADPRSSSHAVKTPQANQMKINSPKAKTQTVEPNKQSNKNQHIQHKVQQLKSPEDNEISVKGIYIPPHLMTEAKLTPIIKLLQQTELNAVVLDVKTDTGQLTYPSKQPLVKDIHSNSKQTGDLTSIIKMFKEEGIYTIGRIVTFKDPYLAGAKKQWAMHRKDGSLWMDVHGVAWIDPYRSEVWDYNIAIAKDAAALGFDEVQFDYVRFPDNGAKVDREVAFHNTENWSKAEVIATFLEKAKMALNQTIYISADVFGLTTSVKDDMGIGQQWGKISAQVDYISPMTYPSHYSSGIYGIRHPDLEPYALITKALKDAKLKNSSLKKQGIEPARVRPWLQSFTASWVEPHQTYGPKAVRDQIEAAKALGIDQYLLWNPLGQYKL